METTRDEQQWIKRLRDRDPKAWDEFFAEFRQVIFQLIRRAALERQWKLQSNDVDDMAAEVFAAFLRSLERYRQECQLRTWITSITRRVVFREFERRWSTKVMRNDAAHLDRADDNSPPPLEMMLETESRARLDRMLKRIPKSIRNVMRLHYLHGLSYREISKYLRISINSVGPALARGRKMLRALIEKNADSGELRCLRDCDAERHRRQAAASNDGNKTLHEKAGLAH